VNLEGALREGVSSEAGPLDGAQWPPCPNTCGIARATNLGFRSAELQRFTPPTPFVPWGGARM